MGRALGEFNGVSPVEEEKSMRRKEQHRETTVVTILISHSPEPYRGRRQRSTKGRREE